MENDDTLIEVSEEELRHKIERIKTDYPEIADITSDDYCCHGHAAADLKPRFGQKAARAWLSMDTAKFLLGE